MAVSPMRIGIDSYSYHRLLGEIRPGENDPGERLMETFELIAEMVTSGAEILSLETVFLAPPGQLDAAAVRRARGDAEIAIAWGHPLGLEWGRRPDRLDELISWIELAPVLGAQLVRCVAAGPALANEPRPERLHAVVRALRAAVRRADEVDVTLALENHADVEAEELTAILGAVPGLTVCLDTANALRVGDDPVMLAGAVGERVTIVHLKDVVAPSVDDGPSGPRSVPFGDGIVDIEGVLAALRTDLRDLPVCVELGHLGAGDVDERALVREGVAWLKRHRARSTRHDGGLEQSR
jgi:sugar phosphate isomerase/epimerase